jgi:GNAT superfamily N-acetyltransferase
VIIRHAAGKDIPGIVALGNHFLNEIPTYGLVIRTEDELRKLDRWLIWVIEDNGKLIGYAICLPKKSHGENIFTDDDKILELDEIYLIPEARRQGLGSELLVTILDYAKNDGYTKFFLDSSVKNLVPVLRFYLNNGLTTWSTQLFKDLK